MVGYGHAVVSEPAVAIGVTAVPTPVTDDVSDLWFVYESLMNDFLVTTDVGRLLAGVQLRFDSKAMRKVEDGEQMISVLENDGASDGSTTLTHFRQLIKLH